MLKRVLIANRGEIALRVLRACRELGIETVAVYSQADADALHVQLAGQAVCIGPARAADSYLNQNALLTVAKATGCDGVHPGYGFLSENADFADACAAAGLTFIGPSGDAIRKAGSKSAARDLMRAAGVPVTPGSDGPVSSVEDALAAAETVGYPVLLKASAGGGGKGIRVAESVKDLKDAYDSASAEAIANFGDGRLYMEKYIHNPRHIEVQILGDNYGNVVHLFERECSVQRRHQKLIEESPSAFVTPELREKMTSAAVALAKRVGYRNAGTIEFLVDNDRNFYFCEMNTRIQVEHPVTEEVTGVDLVCEQLRVAAGEPLSFKQEDLTIRGHAIECRINAEDPSRNFAPCPGTLVSLHLPGGPGVRVDSAAYQGYKIPPFYDSMIGKLIVYGADREQAIVRMRRALAEMLFEGVVTATDYQMHILCSKAFVEANFNVNSIANGDFD
mgnify:CR=1 FL=1